MEAIGSSEVFTARNGETFQKTVILNRNSMIQLICVLCWL